MPLAFPHPPADPSGDWLCDLPDTCSIGEVLVYATAAAVVPPADHFVWHVDETTTPLNEVGGFNHKGDTVTSGSFSFHQTSLRSDAGGYSIGAATLTGGAALLQWSPPVTTVGREYSVAGLIKTPAGGADFFNFFGLNGIIDIHKDWGSTAGETVYVTLNGVATPLASSSAFPNQHLPFVAARVATNGSGALWVTTVAAITWGAQAAYNPAATWNLRTRAGKVGVQFDELHVWDRLATDAEILAVRLDLIGV